MRNAVRHALIAVFFVCSNLAWTLNEPPLAPDQARIVIYHRGSHESGASFRIQIDSNKEMAFQGDSEEIVVDVVPGPHLIRKPLIEYGIFINGQDLLGLDLAQGQTLYLAFDRPPIELVQAERALTETRTLKTRYANYVVQEAGK
jgi:hypothetical protein